MNEKINKLGHKIDDTVGETAKKRGLTRLQTWVLGSLVIIGAITVISWFH